MIPFIQYPILLEVDTDIRETLTFQLKADEDWELRLEAVNRCTSQCRIQVDCTLIHPGKYSESEHVFKLAVDKNEYKINIQLDSPCLGRYEILADLEKMANIYQANLKAQVLTHEITLAGNVTYNSCLDFQGNFNLKMSMPYQGNLDFQVKLDNEQDLVLDLDLTSTHPLFDRLRVQFNMAKNASGNEYNGIIQTIIPSVETDVKVTFTIPRTNIWINQDV